MQFSSLMNPVKGHVRVFEYDQMQKVEDNLRNEIQKAIIASEDLGVEPGSNAMEDIQACIFKDLKTIDVHQKNSGIAYASESGEANQSTNNMKQEAQNKDQQLQISVESELNKKATKIVENIETACNRVNTNVTGLRYNTDVVRNLSELCQVENETHGVYVQRSVDLEDDQSPQMNTTAVVNNMARKTALDQYLSNERNREALLDNLANDTRKLNSEEQNALARLKENPVFRRALIEKLSDPLHMNPNSVLDQIADTHRSTLSSYLPFSTQTRKDIEAQKTNNTGGATDSEGEEQGVGSMSNFTPGKNEFSSKDGA